ncbi:acylneuraminate cytidylyltransferase family protein [Thiomonas bhubaneswarensis]|uniref:CMP-N-acetylneuraminic acid synthetase n=1 Tax=Thiomonas bhubaneswarensis TaxID=339866 RepID=A0A0K6IAQ2_9BURK|nr:acylneuraminate cytidylyltransferase family protein [Thiomonas bhubaneswarensis]CUB00215.1 CMP-N-acetylneuraminic acid synthetase [Thiomonas bhubaneswarensis]
MTTIATICARGGSKGLPGKNILPFAGLPLIHHSIRYALQHPVIGAVYVSTDDAKIAQIAREAGAIVPYLRPPELARDDSPKLPVIEHLVAHLEAQRQIVTRIVDLQPTSPLRAPEDLDGCLARAEAPDAPGLVVSVFDSGFNPYFNLVEEQPDGSVSISKGGGLATRQSAPKVWALNGSIYVWRREALAHAAQHGLWSVSVAAHAMPPKRSVDIDTADDFALAEWLHHRQPT